MKEEKANGLTCHACIHKSHGNLLITVGIIAVVYGAMNYLRVAIGYAWPPYTGWVLGGILLLIIGLIRGYWRRKCC